nr:hypothetical protein [Streptomyces lasiicapitis]
MSQADVIDIDQRFVFVLAVPYLVAGVAGVGEDGPDGALGPGDAAPVRVALWVRC